MKEEGYHCIAIEQAEESLMLNEFDSKLHKNIAVVFGNEVKGVQQSVIDRCDNCIEIPQLGTKHSLNISVSAGIVLWHLFKGNN